MMLREEGEERHYDYYAIGHFPLRGLNTYRLKPEWCARVERSAPATCRSAVTIALIPQPKPTCPAQSLGCPISRPIGNFISLSRVL
jgi:hypothetical protein